MRSIAVAVTFLAAATSASTVLVDCDAGVDDAGCGSTASNPCKTVQHALSLAGSGTVLIDASRTGRCELESTLVVTAANSGVTIASASSSSRVTLSGGRAVDGSNFSPVSSFPSLAAQISSASARASALVASLPSAINATRSTYGDQWAHYYMGGNGCILPDRVAPTGMRFFVAGAWREPAQYPPVGTALSGLPKIVRVLPNRVVQPSPDVEARMQAWAPQFASPLPDVTARGWWNGIGWAVSTLNVTTLTAPTTTSPGTLGIGPGIADESDPEVKGYFTVMNLLAELGPEGSWYLNRTTGQLVVVPPPEGLPSGSGGFAPPEAHGPATVSVLRSAIIRVEGASDVTIRRVRVAYGNGPGVQILDSERVTLDDSIVENVGMMAVNVSGGKDCVVSGASIGATGSGGVWLSGGDRQTLTPGNHTVAASRIAGFSRITEAYAPGVYLEGVGNVATSVEIAETSHMCAYMQGNNHILEDSDIHHCVQMVRDSGAVYMGRDWSARGNVIRGNTMRDLDTYNGGPGGDVQAVYLDDSFSGTTIVNNTFHNVSRAFLLGGGRANTFAANFVNATTATQSPVLFDDRDEGWARSACAPGGILDTLLARVPYNTSAAWISAYPRLAHILQDDPCLPKYNTIANNTYCGIKAAFIDQSAATITKWGSSSGNNVEAC